MINKINLNIYVDFNILKNSKNIYYKNKDVSELQQSEMLIDFTKNQKNFFLAQKEIYHILFVGRKIKQEIKRKLSLVTIKKNNMEKLFDDLNAIGDFRVGKYKYQLKKVDNLILSDLLYAVGGIFDINEIHSAVFFPYFMENKPQNHKMTIIFSNIMFERFKYISREIHNSLGFTFKVDDLNFNLDLISKNDISAWIALHEYSHNSGPLPLFTSTANKFSSKEYGAIEELRVDLTSFKVIMDYLFQVNPDYFRVVIIIILERIFRGALYNYNPNWNLDKNIMFSREVEGDISIAMMIILEKYKFLDLNNRTININILKFKEMVDEIVKEIYFYEELANKKNAFDKTYFKFSLYFRKKYLILTPTVRDFLEKNYVHNCKYKINFYNSITKEINI